ncbi:unnamed protein product [Cladocopium goreaui]|uniref:tyrosine--tRNA ligase n=1 Tax=Cladocopium goreaui TaxID=2562237 RepID=A0A9P1BMU9_9DINO|nr:unnamed protein product [Cladocopium goreaui]
MKDWWNQQMRHVSEQPRAALVLLESEGIENNNNQTGDVSEQPTALVLPESEGIENNNNQTGDVSMLDDGSESEKEIHPINTKLLQDVMRNFRQQIRQFDPSRSPSEKWSHLVQWFDITDMRLRFAHSSVSRTFRQPPHNGYKLTELVDSFLHGDERPENMPPLVAVDWEGKLWVVCGNRRLWTLREFVRYWTLWDQQTTGLKRGSDDAACDAEKQNHCIFVGSGVANFCGCKVSAWRRGEDLGPAKSSPTHLKLDDLGNEALFVVVAPVPSELVLLSDVLEVLRSLGSGKGKRVLWIQDWSARATGAAGGSAECIKAYYDLLLHGLHSVDPQLMSEVAVRWQGEAILSGPSDYWTSVINAGRQGSLEAIRGALAEEENLDSAGQVVATIMHLGDVLALAGGRDVVLCSGPSTRNLNALAAKHAESSGFSAPQIETTEPLSLRLQAKGEGLEADTQILVTDKEMDINRKFKKAFCEPGNVDFCPPVNWVEALLSNFNMDEFVVKRKEQNGGDLEYSSAERLKEEFGEESLHPGDLKPSLAKAMNAAMLSIRDGMKKADLKKALKLCWVFFSEHKVYIYIGL